MDKQDKQDKQNVYNSQFKNNPIIFGLDVDNLESENNIVQYDCNSKNSEIIQILLDNSYEGFIKPMNIDHSELNETIKNNTEPKSTNAPKENTEQYVSQNTDNENEIDDDFNLNVFDKDGDIEENDDSDSDSDEEEYFNWMNKVNEKLDSNSSLDELKDRLYKDLKSLLGYSDEMENDEQEDEEQEDDEKEDEEQEDDEPDNNEFDNDELIDYNENEEVSDEYNEGDSKEEKDKGNSLESYEIISPSENENDNRGIPNIPNEALNNKIGNIQTDETETNTNGNVIDENEGTDEAVNDTDSNTDSNTEEDNNRTVENGTNTNNTESNFTSEEEQAPNKNNNKNHLETVYRVQVGVFSSFSNAMNSLANFMQMGYSGNIIPYRNYFAVQLGEFENLDDAAEFEKELRANGNDTLIVRVGY